VAWLLVAGLVVFHGVNIMRAADWSPGDDYMFTRSTAAGEWMGFAEQVRTYEKRFFPLAFQEFNLLVGAGNAPRMYYALQLVKYLLTLGVMALVARQVLGGLRCADHVETPPGRRRLSGWSAATLGAIIVASVFLLQPRMHLAFGHMIYPESMEMLWLALFVLLAYRGVRGGHWGNYALSLLCGSMVLYYKETAFALVLPVAAVPLVARWRSMKPAQRAWSVGLLLSIALWFALYWVFVYSRAAGGDYASNHATHESTVLSFVRVFLDPTTIYPAMLALGSYRAAAIARALCRRRVREWPMERLFVDSLLFGGLLYIAAFAVLRLADIRYLPPSNVLFTVVCLYYARELIEKPRGRLDLRALARSRLAVAGAALLALWLGSRLTCHVVGFGWLHDIRRTWAPHLRLIAHHTGCPVVFVVADDPAPWPADRPQPLNLFFTKASLACIRVQMPDNAPSLQPAYLDMGGDLPEVDAVGDSEVRIEVFRELPASGEYFLFVPRRVEDFPRMMRDRYGLEVVRISRFAFEDRWVREIWVTRAFARRLRERGWLPVLAGGR
jgi:hypothetical protein